MYAAIKAAGGTGKPLMADKKQKKTGPKAAWVKIKGNWKTAVGDALKKERPKEGWPEPDKEKD